jgi:competence protein ComEC
MQSIRVAFLILGFLFFLNVLTWITVYDLNKPNFFEVIFFDVGQGDAIFIETPQNHQILIDGGPGSAILERLAKEMPFWDRTIDLIILSHPEHDHMAGLIEVLKRYKVDNILWTGVARNTSEYNEWVGLVEEEGAIIKIAQAGQKIELGPPVDMGLYILSPSENLEGETVKNINNTSIIARLVFAENSFLFTGDAYKSIEEKLVESGIDLDSDVLKVGHHGSKTSTSEEFIRAVTPEIAVISAGKNNPYHHPHQETLETLGKYDIKVLRTDKDGDVKILCDSQSLKLKLLE